MENQNEQILIDNNKNLQNLKIKKKFNFKLFLSILYLSVLIGAIATITTLVIIFSNEVKDFNFGFNAPDYIVIHTSDRSSSSNKQSFDSNSEEYKTIMELYNKSFQISKLDAIFQGISNKNVTVNENFKYISESSMTGTYIEFKYNENQDVYFNGEKYNAKSISDTSYNTIVIDILNSDSLIEVNAYFKYRQNSSNEYSYVGFASYAMQADLHEYIESL